MTQIVAVAWLVLQWHGSGLQLGARVGRVAHADAGVRPLGRCPGRPPRPAPGSDRDPEPACRAEPGAVRADRQRSRQLLADRRAVGAGRRWSTPSMRPPARCTCWNSSASSSSQARSASTRSSSTSHACSARRLGGVLLAISGPAACVLVNAVSFAAPLAVLLHLHAAARRDSRARPVMRARRCATACATRGRTR